MAAQTSAYLDERPAEERSNQATEPTPLDAFANLALGGGTFLGKPFAKPPRDDARFENKERRFSAAHGGFDVHCAVRIAADDDEGRERLIRYCARPPFALDRIEPLKDGRIAYRMKTPRRGSTHRVMSPMEFMARLSILIPPPYFPLTRYHGVFAARSSWRALVIPKPPSGTAVPQRKKAKGKPCDAPPPPEPRPSAVLPLHPSPPSPPTSPSVALRETDDPMAITVRHWSRILDGELYAATSRIEWALLLKRTYGIDGLACPNCGGRLRPIATITDEHAVHKILSHLGRRTEPLPRARARDPTGQESFHFQLA